MVFNGLQSANTPLDATNLFFVQAIMKLYYITLKLEYMYNVVEVVEV